MQCRAVQGNARFQAIGEVGERGAYQILEINAAPFVPHQQVLIGRERLDTFGQARDEVLRVTRRSLVGNGLHE